MKLTDKVYDILKWAVALLLPAISTLYSALAAVWGWPYAVEITKTIAALCTFGGALLGISCVTYNKEH